MQNDRKNGKARSFLVLSAGIGHRRPDLVLRRLFQSEETAASSYVASESFRTGAALYMQDHLIFCSTTYVTK